jgi:hypothetical protein
MKANQIFMFLLMISASQLAAQTNLQFRYKADSCIKVGNIRAADSLYSCAIAYRPEAQDYMSRAALRKKTEHCRACGDLFSASVLGDKNAVKQFRRDCYRLNKTTICAKDSFTIFYPPGRAVVKQKIANQRALLYETDTAFKKVQLSYLSGKDTLTLKHDTCIMPDSVKQKFYTWVRDNHTLHRAVAAPLPTLTYWHTSVIYTTGCLYAIAFDSLGAVLDVQVVNGNPGVPGYDTEVLRVIRTMPPLGSWGCPGRAYRVVLPIYLSYK